MLDIKAVSMEVPEDANIIVVKRTLSRLSKTFTKR
jgi:hypothetical protein